MPQPRRRFFRPRVEALERRELLTHLSPVDLGDGLGPRFIGDGFTTVTEDFSNNPNHEVWSTVPGGFDSLQAGNERLFTHSANPVQIVLQSQLDLPRTGEPTHVLALGTSDVAEIHFRGIHPDYEVAAVSVDVVSDGWGDVRTTVIGDGGSLVFQEDGHHVATRGSLIPGTQTELGSIRTIRFFTVGAFSAAIDNVTLLLAPRETNDPPTALDDRAATPRETQLLIDVLGNDFDPDADPLTISLPATATLRGGQVALFGQQILYTPPVGFPLASDQTDESRTDRFSYVLRDDDGNTAAADVEVFVNTPPLVPGTFIVRERGATSVGGVLNAGSDADGDPLTLELVAGPQRGELLIDLDRGQFQYSPDDPSDRLDDVFTYRVVDSFGAGSNVAEARLSVTNQPPVASGFFRELAHGALGPLEGNLGTDPDGDPLEIELLPFDHDGDPQTPDVTGPQHGRLRFTPDGRFRYDQLAPDYIHWASGRLVTNDLRFRGPDRFRYRLRDHALVSQPAMMELSVTNNRPPQAEFLALFGDGAAFLDRFRIPPQEASFSVPGVLWNDLDPNADPLTAVLVDGPDHGSLVLRSDGSFVYTPDAGYTGLDGFHYRASDGFLTSAVTQVELLIEPGAAVATDDFYSQLATEFDLRLPPYYPSGAHSILDNDALGANELRASRIEQTMGLTAAADGTLVPRLLNMVDRIAPSDEQLGPDGLFIFEEQFLGTRHFAYALQSRGGYLSNTALVTLHSRDGDHDGDGVLDSEEGVLNPGSFAHRDPQIATLRNAADGRLVQLALVDVGQFPSSIVDGALAEVAAVDNPGAVPPPPGVEFPVGFVEFQIRDLPAGADSHVQLTLPPGVEANTYWKFGRQPADDPATAGLNESTTPHWYEFLFDGVTGAEFTVDQSNRTVVTLHFVDGQRGDDDLAANGVIVDPGAPGLAAPPRVESVTVGDGSSQRSMVQRLTVAFDTLVTIERNAFVLRRLSPGRWKVPLRVAVDEVAGRTVATLTFRGRAVMGRSLPDGQYRLTIRASKIRDAHGRVLDGDGDGAAGGNYVDEIFRRFGDTDGDGDVDAADLAAFEATYGRRPTSAAYLWFLDFNANDKIGKEDRALFRMGLRLSKWR